MRVKVTRTEDLTILLNILLLVMQPRPAIFDLFELAFSPLVALILNIKVHKLVEAITYYIKNCLCRKRDEMYLNYFGIARRTDAIDILMLKDPARKDLQEYLTCLSIRRNKINY